MIRSWARASWFAALSAGLLLAGCSESAPEPGPAAAKTSKPAGPKTADPGANMVAAVPAGKSSKYVGVHFSLGNSPVVNQALPVDIAVIPHEDYVSLRGRFESQDGLTLMSGDALPLKKNAGSEQPIKHQIVLMPARAGVFVITASIETEGAEGMVSRVFSIPVIVSDVAPPPATVPPAAPTPPAENPGAN
jgi:hypothetical protein